MRSRVRAFPLAMGVLLAALGPGAPAGEMIVSQKYTVARLDRPEEARDVVQKLFLGKERIRIEDEVETVLIDLKAETLATYRHKEKTWTKETFAERKKSIEEDKALIRDDLEAVASRKQQDKMRKMYRYFLDDDRRYRIEWPGGEPGETKKIADVECRRARIVDDEGEEVYDGYVHPSIEMLYDSADVLYLLKIISQKLAQTLKSDARFKRLPMSLGLKLAYGGSLQAEVIKFETVEAIDEKEFKAPEGYRFIGRAAAPGERKKDQQPD